MNKPKNTVRDLFRCCMNYGRDLKDIQIVIDIKGEIYTLCQLWSDTGYDVSFELSTYTDTPNPDINVSAACELFATREDIKYDEELQVYEDYHRSTVKDIVFDSKSDRVILYI